MDTYFELDVRDRYMLVVAVLRESYRDVVPAVCHVDGTCRVQAVAQDHPEPTREADRSVLRTDRVPPRSQHVHERPGRAGGRDTGGGRQLSPIATTLDVL